MSSNLTYKPRNDNVLIRITTVDKVASMFMPQSSAQGKQFYVVAAGPKVEDLKVGDRVIIVARQGEGEFYPLPTDSDMFVVKQEFVALVVEKGLDA